MLSTGAVIVPSACLRCQLRQVIFRTGKRVSVNRIDCLRWRASRAFGASCPRFQDAHDQVLDDKVHGKEKSKLSEYPLGRIYGKPGRRHRETSARLTQDSMQKPFEVVVLRDVPDAKGGNEADQHKASSYQETNHAGASQIARDILSKNASPKEAEIFDSIDALRPPSTIIAEEEYESLAKDLADGYNTRQLSRYLSRSLQSISLGPPSQVGRKALKWRENALQTLAWRPRISPTDEATHKTTLFQKDDAANPKYKLVEQILRQSWSVSIDGELYQIGYLDMKLEAWHLSFLFDLYENSRPMYEAWIKNPLLLRSSEIRPDRAHNVLRITARKQDAEEIAARIQQKFREFESLELDLTALKPLRTRRQPSKFHEYLPDQTSLHAIQRRLFCIFERRDKKTLVIHAPLEVTLWQARRAFLSFIDLPSPSSIKSTIVATSPIDIRAEESDGNAHLLPDQPAQGMKSRQLALRYARLARSTEFAENCIGSESSNTTHFEANTKDSFYAQVSSIAEGLSAVKPLEPITFDSPSETVPFWELGDRAYCEPWEVQFCKVLYNNTKSGHMRTIQTLPSRGQKVVIGALDTSPSQSTIQPQVPGIATLVSYFSPTLESVKSPLIVAHFVPNPFTTNGLAPLTKLPRIRMRYSVSTNTERSTVKLQGIRAVLSQQEFRVHLPQEATDVRFVRQCTIRALSNVALGDRDIQNFTAMLQHSLNRKRAFLDGEPMVKFRLPGSPFDDLTDPWARDLRKNGFEVDYLFERFEQVQSLDLDLNFDTAFSANVDPSVKNVLSEYPTDVFLRYQEIEGGIVGGQRTELRLVNSAGSVSTLGHDDPGAYDTGYVGGGEQADVEENLRLVKLSLRLANALTRINAGDVEYTSS